MPEIQVPTYEAKKEELRLRVWLAMVYEDSAKDNWQQILSDELLVKAAISPLHDRDVFDSDYEEDELGYSHKAGDPKKPHYHVVFQFAGKKSYKQVDEIMDLITKEGCKHLHPKVPHGTCEEAVQYLIHKNHKNKAQYLKSGIVSLNGFDVERYFRLNEEQENELFCALRDYISENNIYNYWQLFEFLAVSMHRSALYEEMWTFCRKHTILVRNLLLDRAAYKKDVAYKQQHEQRMDLLKDKDGDKK